nr:WAP four-disulfide core domain protein 18-like [Anolis sagrei ordinatus]
MEAHKHLLALALLLLTFGEHLASSAPSSAEAKKGYCFQVPPLGDVFDEKDCSTCEKNGSCSTCASDAQCPATQKCCPGDCGYVCQEAIFVKDGVCPPKIGSWDPKQCRTKCTRDKQCPGKKKCCQVGCGKECLEAMPVC